MKNDQQTTKVNLKIMEIIVSASNIKCGKTFIDARDALEIEYQVDEFWKQKTKNPLDFVRESGVINPIFKAPKKISKTQIVGILREIITEDTLKKDNEFSRNASFYQPFFNDLKARFNADQYALIIHCDESYNQFYENYYNNNQF
jgi:hypothetical protein